MSPPDEYPLGGAMDDSAQLIEQAICGDRAALERLLLDHYDPLAARLAPRLPASIQSVVSVEDIVQQTFTQVFRDIEHYQPQPDATFFAWLCVIAENRLRDAIRRHQRKKRGGGRTRVQATKASNRDSAAGDLLDALAGSGHTPSKSMARREGIQAMQIAIAALPDEYQLAVRLRYFEGHSLEETARHMGRTTGAVRGLLDRAKTKMRDVLARASKYLTTK